MAIKSVNATSEENDVKFDKNQSSILHTLDTNTVTVNGVNVEVKRPKKGDVLCVNGGQVVWIDGLSINPAQLPQGLETVGICVAINGNKAIVKYRKGETFKWAAANSYLLADTIKSLFDNVSHTLKVSLNGTEYEFTFSANSYQDFNAKLNSFLKGKNNQYSSKLVNNQIVINCTSFNKPIITNKTSGVAYQLTGKTASDINENRLCYRNNGFTCIFTGCYAGYCRGRYFEYVYYYCPEPSEQMTDINFVAGPDVYAAHPYDFYNNDYCKILRDNFVDYDEYFDSMMVKYPCGKGDVIAEFPSGKESTYKLANYTFIDNVSGEESPLYPAANHAASINVDAPGLEAGNWWLPSPAEMVQMMYDVTYDTNFWDEDNIDNNTDIINRVLFKLNSFDSDNWDMLSALYSMWASAKYSPNNAYIYCGADGNIRSVPMNTQRIQVPIYDQAYLIPILATPITIYEF